MGDLSPGTASPVTPTPPRGYCEGLRKNGKPCRARPLKNERFCLAHHPDRRDLHREISSRGGKASWHKRLGDIGEFSPIGAVITYLKNLMRELEKPGLPSDEIMRLRAATYAASTLLRAVESYSMEEEYNDLLRRIDDLEDRWLQ